MADPKGFMKVAREVAVRRPVEERVHDWDEVYRGSPGRAVLPIIRQQASRCMDCGIPFCHQGCPLGNLIPEWNDLIYNDLWRAATDRLHATNNFPEFTGRICPAPCEEACTLNLEDIPVAIKTVEQALADKAYEASEAGRAEDEAGDLEVEIERGARRSEVLRQDRQAPTEVAQARQCQPHRPTCATTSTWRCVVASRSSRCPPVPLLQRCSITTSTSC